jgi:hypothetical protein
MVRASSYLGKEFMVTNIRQLVEEKLRNYYPYLLLEDKISQHVKNPLCS